MGWTDGARSKCFFVGRDAGPCSGVIIRAHLIPKQRLRRELMTRTLMSMASKAECERVVGAVVWDPRVWVPMCGGPMGNAGHHGAFDQRQIRIARAALPAELEEFAQEYGLEWSLERDYGPKET